MGDYIPKIVEGEAYNYGVSLNTLASTAGLIDDLDEAYATLPSIVRPLTVRTEHEQYANLAVIHLLWFCRRQLTVSGLTLLRAYHADAMVNLRRAIEASAIAQRISKHHDLAKIWWSAAQTSESYRTYKRAFKSAKIFPTHTDADFDTRIGELYHCYGLLSRIVHGSIYSVAGMFEYSYDEEATKRFYLKFFDLAPGHSLVSALYMILDCHMRMLSLFGDMLCPYADGQFNVWLVRYNSVEAKLALDRERWKNTVPISFEVEDICEPHD